MSPPCAANGRAITFAASACVRPYALGPETPLGVGLDHDASEIRDALVEIVDRLLPPSNDALVKRVEGVEPADLLGTAEIDGEHQAHAPRAERFCETHQFRTVRRGDQPRVGVDVVDRAAVQAERRQQPRIVTRSRQIRRARVHRRRTPNVRRSRVRSCRRGCPTDSPSGLALTAAPGRRCRRAIGAAR